MSEKKDIVDYKIEVGVTPHFHDNKMQPYYWTLFAYGD